jgi:hypothetical protein
MESKKDDGPEKARFLAVRGEIYKRYTAQQKAKDQVASSALKRSITQREEEGEVIEMDGDVTSPSAAKQAHRTLADRLMKRPTVEEFINAWSEAVLGKGLTFDFFSDPLVRKAILVTAQCADSIITFAGSSAKDTLLPKRSTWTQKILPQTDARLQQEAMEILTPIYKEIGCCIMSDGWQSTSNRPILNVIAAADGHVNVRRAFDASGLDKNMPFIADFVMKEIKALVQEHVFSCTMDGACKGAFPMIKHAMPWVQCFSCPSHGLDKFIQNALSDSATIRMQANAMSNVEFTTIAWGETLFKNTFETAWQIVQAVVSHQKPLALFRKIAALPAFAEIGATEPLKYADTRYGSRVLMGRRLLTTRSIYRNLMVDTEMEAWLQRQKPDTQQKFNKVSNVILAQADFWKNLDLCCQIFEPALQALRVSDGMKGGTPAILYNMCLGLDKLYSEPIDGLDESIRKKVHALFMARWNTFHAPVHSACFLMDKAFCRMEHDSAAKLELIQVIKDFCTAETADGTKVGRDWKVVKSEYVAWQESIARKQHDLHDEHKLNQPAGAFTERSMQRSQQSWVKTYMEDITDSSGRALFDNLAWFAKKLCSVMTSASACEHMWSIAGWIHSKRRNRLAQPTVEKAVRAHGNLVLRKAMMQRNKNVVAWDSQTAITEPDRYTDEQGVDDVDEEDSADEQ